MSDYRLRPAVDAPRVIKINPAGFVSLVILGTNVVFWTVVAAIFLPA